MLIAQPYEVRTKKQKATVCKYLKKENFERCYEKKALTSHIINSIQYGLYQKRGNLGTRKGTGCKIVMS